MSSKKIDRIFQEKLKDLEMSPNPEVWNKIEASLATQKKSKKRVFWWFASAGSVAAILLLFFLSTDTKQNTNTKVASKNKTEQKEKETSKTVTQKESATKINSIQKDAQNVKKNNQKLTPAIKKVIPKTTFFSTIKEQKKTKVVVVRESKNKEILDKEFKNEAPNFNNTNQPTNQVLLAEALTPKKSLEETLLKEEEEKQEKEQKEDRKKEWSIAPVVSQYAYNSFSNNSTIDNRLNEAKKSGKSDLAYGVNVAYQISKKIKIKTGIHKIHMTQNTQNQFFESSFTRIASYQNAQPKIVEINTATTSITNSEIQFSDVESAQSLDIETLTGSSSELEQSFGYIEVPIEVNYNLFGTEQFSVYISGGFSTLFLTENNLVEQNGLFSQSLGGVTNLNNLNFSLNFGTDLEYHFSKKWFINLNPSVRIQTQTFNKDSNQPYLLGVSSGINYKF